MKIAGALTPVRKAILARMASEDGFASTSWCAPRNVKTALAYQNLRRLQELGLVERDSRRGYWPMWRITDAGRAHVAAQRAA